MRTRHFVNILDIISEDMRTESRIKRIVGKYGKREFELPWYLSGRGAFCLAQTTPEVFSCQNVSDDCAEPEINHPTIYGFYKTADVGIRTMDRYRVYNPDDWDPDKKPDPDAEIDLEPDLEPESRAPKTLKDFPEDTALFELRARAIENGLIEIRRFEAEFKRRLNER